MTFQYVRFFVTYSRFFVTYSSLFPNLLQLDIICHN